MCWDAVFLAGYPRCTHQLGRNRSKVDCQRPNCALSANHMRGAHNCETTCAQQSSGPMRVVHDQNIVRCDKCSFSK